VLDAATAEQIIQGQRPCTLPLAHPGEHQEGIPGGLLDRHRRGVGRPEEAQQILVRFQTGPAVLGHIDDLKVVQDSRYYLGRALAAQERASEASETFTQAQAERKELNARQPAVAEYADLVVFCAAERALLERKHEASARALEGLSFCRAASQMVVPAGTATGRPSRVRWTSGGAATTFIRSPGKDSG